MKSILVIGMGKFGKMLATKMMELGNNVMIVDKNEEVINELAPQFSNALIGNCTNEGVLRSLGVNNFDYCFVAIGDDFQSSLEITSQLKELKAKYVISKAERDIQAKFLLRNGADEIIYPEKDVVNKFAIRISEDKIFDFIELSKDYAIIEIAIPKKWVGCNLIDLDIRNEYQVNVLAVRKNGVLKPIVDANYVFEQDDHAMVIGDPTKIDKIN
ncbi:MAG: TrkA family potassium uptake protein [Clostridia bacterium]